MIKRICLVEDDPSLNPLLQKYLESAGYTVIPCRTFEESTTYFNKNIHLWVVDLMLPDGNGLELLKTIKAQTPYIPVIIISAKSDRFDRVAGFEVGCDDYICKPFLPAELVFRIKKLAPPPAAEPAQDRASLPAPYRTDLSKRIIYLNDKKINLTSKEFDIILYFLEHPGQPLSRAQLLKDIWAIDYTGSDRTVDNYVKNIRRKLPALSIETIYGFGYRYNQ